MIGGLELTGHAGGGRLVIEPVISSDNASCLWLYHRDGSSGRCVWLNPAQLRALSADLAERADLLDPPAPDATPTQTGA